jgi:replication-associated recombination protein RarA
VSGGAFRRLETVHGYPLDEVASSLQKLIRRGMSDEAIWMAIELNESGFGAYAWRRLLVIVSEDIGLADHHAPVLVNALYQMSVELYKAAKARTTGAEQKERVRWNEESLTHAIWYLARAQKSRELCDQYAAITLRMKKGERLEIPDFALDMHTARGRAMGRGIDHFNDEGDKLFPALEIEGDRWGKAWEAERPRHGDEGSDSVRTREIPAAPLESVRAHLEHELDR